MPVRSFRIFLSNNTDLPLIRTAHVLCPVITGDPIWTSSAWEPPPTIPPRTELGWQAESNGVAAGVTGFVKYRLALPAEVIPGGNPPPPRLADEVYVYWVNPFLAGVPTIPPTRAKCAIDPVQVSLDCNPEQTTPAGGGTFSPSPSIFEIVPEVMYDRNHPDWTFGRDQGDNAVNDETARDLLAIYAGGVLSGGLGVLPILGEGLIGEGSIVPHAWARFTVRQRGSVRQAFSLAYKPEAGIRSVIGRQAIGLRALFGMRPT